MNIITNRVLSQRELILRFNKSTMENLQKLKLKEYPFKKDFLILAYYPKGRFILNKLDNTVIREAFVDSGEDTYKIGDMQYFKSHIMSVYKNTSILLTKSGKELIL